MSSKYAEMSNEELNVAVAEKVMGWELRKSKNGWRAWWERDSVASTKKALQQDWRPSTDIAAAWQVVEKMRERGLAFDCGSPHSRRVKISEWWARFGPYPHVEPTPGDTPARAICLAALQAIDQSPSPVSSKAGEFNQGSKGEGE